jgi:chaperone BCS1
VHRYENSKSFYNTRQIPYKRGYILYGPPGTGKTTIIKMIASTFNKNIYKISIDEETVSLKSLISNIDCIYDNSILLIEDIDRLFNSDMEEDYSIMSDFLNLLDGLDSVYNCLTFITTNNYVRIRVKHKVT